MKKNTYCVLFLLLTILAESKSQSYVAEKNNPKIKVKPVADIEAFAFNLKDVRLLSNSPFKNAMDKDAAYLLLLDPQRLLHRFT